MKKTSNFSFRKMALVVLAFASILAFSAFSKDGKDTVVQRFKDACLNLDNTYHTLVNEFDYWPECGIRVTGSHLASLISLSELQEMLPCQLYVSGPHHDGQWDLENEEEFGHYNPEAIKYLGSIAKTIVSDKSFIESSKPLVDRYLYRQMHIMMVIHDALYDGGYSQEERETIFRTSVESHGWEYTSPKVDFFLHLLKLEDGSFVYGNIDYRFLHFWARRWSDGTIDQFYEVLSTVFKAYHPEYKFIAETYWMSPDDFEEEWYGEEEYDGGPEYYVVIDGSELRLRLGPSTSADTFKWPDGTNRHPKVGERFLYLGEEGDFYQIDFHGNQLWVSKKYTHLE
ncbi:MAG: hypothetical protein IKT08_08260 [Bacteroidales bacterium]|nr:hypothetical protein [Bacteroidales bacterium]